MFHHQKFVKSAFCKNALLNSTSFSPLNYWRKLLDVAELLSASKQSKKRPRKYKLKAEVSITPLLAALLAACSNETVPVGGTLDGTNVTTPTGDETPALPFDLYVLDGAVEGALVYVDENDNGAMDDNESLIGTTDENGRVSIEAEYAGETFFIDASGALDLFTGESLPNNTFYRAISEDRGGADVVASPISTVIEALKDSDPELTPEAILAIIFGENTQIDMDDLNNPDNYILPLNADPKPIDSPEAIAEQIASTNIRLQVLIEQAVGNLDTVVTAVTNGGFVVTDDLTPASQREATARIVEARERANGEPVANPVAGIEVNEDEDLPLAMDVWGFRDPVGNRNDDNTPPSSFARLDIVSITNGVLVASDGTEYGAGAEIPSAQLGNLVFRPATDYSGSVQITYTVFDGEDDSDEATLAITVNGINDAPVIDRTDVETEFSIAGGSTANVIEITATDVEGDTLIYSIRDTDADAALFQISDTGVVRWATPPVFDASSDNLYSVTVVVSDGDATDTITLTITVTDIDANAPVFSSDGSPPNQDENIAANNSDDSQASAVTIYEARAESASGGDVTYSLAGTDGALFGIDAEGDIWFRASPDHENKSSYSFTVVASVTVNDVELTTEQAVTLELNDLNDSPPEFSSGDKASASATVAVNDDGDTQGSAATIYTAIAAPDDAGDTVVYSLTSADTTTFGINASTGDVWFKTAPDYTTNSSYSFTVQASVTADGMTETATQTVMVSANATPTITLGDTDDLVVSDAGSVYGKVIVHGIEFTAKPGTNPSGIKFTESNSGFDVDLFILMGSQYDELFIYDPRADSERVYTRDSIIAEFNVDDQDNTRYEAALVEAGTGSVTISFDDLINGGDGSGFFATPLVETAADLAADGTLEISDLETSAAELKVFIDNEDTDSDSTTTEIAHDGSADTIVDNISGDGSYGSFTFTRTPDGGVSWTYALDDTNSTVNALDVGETATDSVWVRVEDDANSTVEQITVTIAGANDAPTLTFDGTPVSIAENIDAETDTGVTLTPADVDVNTTFTADSFTVYEGSATTESERFGVILDNGVFKLVLLSGNALNHEAGDEIALRVFVSDGALTSEAVDVTVTVTDVNDAPTITLGDTDDLLVSEAGSVYGKVIVHGIEFTAKPGIPPSGIRFSFSESGPSDRSFSIELGSQPEDVSVYAASSDAIYTLAEIINQFNVAQQDNTRYMAALEVDNTGHVTISLDVLSDGENGSGFFAAPLVETAADLVANGSLVLGDADEGDTVTSLDVFIGNEDEATSNITMELLDVPLPLAGMGASDVTLDATSYGTFTLTRTAAGVVTWTYTLNEDAVNALDAGETATDSVWVRVQDGNLDNSVQEIKVLITGANDAPTLSGTETAEIPENSDAETDTGVTLTPADVDVNTTFDADSFTVYEGTDTTASTRFGVIDDNGVFRLVLRANNPLNFETEQTINLRVVVSDGALTSEAVDVTVTVTDVDDAPTLTLSATDDLSVTEGGLALGNIIINGIEFTPKPGASPTGIQFTHTVTSPGFDAPEGAFIFSTDFEYDSITIYDPRTDPAYTRTKILEDFDAVRPRFTRYEVALVEAGTGSVEVSLTELITGGDGSGFFAAPLVDIAVDLAAGGTLNISDAETSLTELQVFGGNSADEVLTVIGRGATTLFAGNNAYSGFVFTRAASGEVTWTYNVAADDAALNALGANETATDSVWVRVNDGNSDSEVQEIKVLINGVNDAPTLTFDGTAEIVENVPANTDTGISFTAIDVDGDTLTFTVYEVTNVGTPTETETISSRFGVVADVATYRLTTLTLTNNSFDSATEPSINLRVVVSDGTLSASQDVTITVDENTAPTLTLDTNDVLSVTESGAVAPTGTVFTVDGLVFTLKDDATSAGIQFVTGSTGGQISISGDVVTLGPTNTAGFQLKNFITTNVQDLFDNYTVTLTDNVTETDVIQRSDVVNGGNGDGFFLPEAFIIHGIEFILDPGESAENISFVGRDYPDIGEVRIEATNDNSLLIGLDRSTTTFKRSDIVDAVNGASNSKYTARVFDGFDGNTQIHVTDLRNGGDGGTYYPPFVLTETAGEPETSGTLEIGDAGTSLTNLEVYVGLSNSTQDMAVTVGQTTTISSADGLGDFAFTRATDGTVTWTFTVDNNNSDVNAIPAGGFATDRIFVRVSDGNLDSPVREITITINGVNDAPTVNTEHNDYDVTDTHEAGDREAASGRWVVEDDGGGTLIYSVPTQGEYGTLRFGTDGNWGYAIDTMHSAIRNLNDPSNPTTLTDTITVRATDEFGVFVDGTVTVTINDATNTLYVNRGTGDDGEANDRYGDADAPDQQIIQGAGGDDFLQSGREGDIIIGGTGNDDIQLQGNSATSDRIVYRIASTDDGLFGLDGNDTVHDFSITRSASRDDVVFVDTDGTPLGSFADLLDLGKTVDADGNSQTPQLTVTIREGAHPLNAGLIFTFLGDTTTSTDDTTLTLNFERSFLSFNIIRNIVTGGGGISNNQLTNAGLTSFANNFNNDFDVFALEEFGIEII